MTFRSVCLLAIWAASMRAESLTIDRALSLAEQYNPELRAAAAGVEGAEAGIVTARQHPNPEFATGFGRQQITANSNVPGHLGDFSLSQPLELGSVRRARIRTAQAGSQSAEYRLRETRLDVRSAVKQAFYEVLRRQGELDLTRGDLGLITDLRRRVQAQVQAGEAARLELTRAEAEVAAAGIRVRSSELRAATALAGLRAAVGAPLANVTLDGKLSGPIILPPLETLRQEVLSRHPAVSQAEAEIRRADARLSLERELRKPQPTVHTDIERQPDAYLVRLGVTLPIPAWNRRQGEIGEARAALRQAQAMGEQRRLEISAALERAYGQYQVSNEALLAFEAGALKEAEAALQAAEAAFRFGERGIIEVLDAQRVLRGVRLDYLNAQYDREAALIELERLEAIDLGSTP